MLLLPVLWYVQAMAAIGGWVSTILTPGTRQDRRIDNLQRVRVWLGFALLAFVIARSSDDVSSGGSVDVAGLLQGAMLAPFVKRFIALPCFVVGVAVLALSRPSGSRTAVAVAAGKPVLAALLLLAGPAVPSARWPTSAPSTSRPAERATR